MKRFHAFALALALSCGVIIGFVAAAPAEDKAEKEKDIRKLMEVTGSGQLGVQMLHQMVESFKQSYPTVPTEFWDEFSKEVKADGVVDLIVPIYDKQLSQADIQEAIKFYESPSGKRIVKALPEITKESYGVGQKWGQTVAAQAIEKLKAKGILK